MTHDAREIIATVADCLPGLLLFARTPERGKVKTRLVPPLSEPEALDLYRAFLQDASDYADAEIVLLVTGANVSPEVLRRAVT